MSILYQRKQERLVFFFTCQEKLTYKLRNLQTVINTEGMVHESFTEYVNLMN